MFNTAPTLTVEQFRWMKAVSVDRGLRSGDIPAGVAAKLLANRYIRQQSGHPVITPAGRAALSSYTGPVF